MFVQQLAARLRTKELKEFFEKVGPVAEAQIVKDRVSNRSKGYASLSLRHSSPKGIVTLTSWAELAMLNSRTKNPSLLRYSSLVRNS